MQKREALLFFYLIAFLFGALYAFAEKPGDYDNDGCVTQDDYGEFSVAYTAGDAAANLDGNGVVDLEDFFYFSNLIEQDKDCSRIVGVEETASLPAAADTAGVGEETIWQDSLEQDSLGVSGASEGQNLVERMNQYYDVGEASCTPGSVSAECEADSCVDCSGACVLSGQVLAGYKGEYEVYNNQYGCFQGKWDGCDSEDDLGRLRPGVNGDGTFLCTSVNEHLEWVSCTPGVSRDVYTLQGNKHVCKENGWGVEEESGEMLPSLEVPQGVVQVPSIPVLTASPIGNMTVLLSWQRSGLVDESLTGKIVLNKISGAFVINEITGRVVFIDSIIDFFKRIFGIKTKAARIGGGKEIVYEVYRADTLGNFNHVGQVNDKDCQENCKFKDRLEESGGYRYRVEACFADVCKSSEEAVVFVSLDAEEVGITGVTGVEESMTSPDGKAGVAGESGEAATTEQKLGVEGGEGGEIPQTLSCNVMGLFQQYSALLGNADAEGIKKKWNEEIVPCCSAVLISEQATELEKNACSGVKAQ